MGLARAQFGRCPGLSRADSATCGAIGFRGLQGLFACCPIIVVDVPLAPVQASLEESNLIDPVVAVFAAIAHCHRNAAPHSHRKLGRFLLGLMAWDLRGVGGLASRVSAGQQLAGHS